MTHDHNRRNNKNACTKDSCHIDTDTFINESYTLNTLNESMSLIDRTVHYSFCWRLRRPVRLFEVTQISLSLIIVNLEMPYFTTVKTTYGSVVYRSPRATHTMSPIIRVQRRPPTTISTIVLFYFGYYIKYFSLSLSPKRRRIKLFSWSWSTSIFPRTVWYTKR